MPVSGVLFADVDGDGSKDAAFLEWNQPSQKYYQLAVLLNDGSGNLSAPIRSDASSTSYETSGDFVLADFRNTGRPDFLEIAPNYDTFGNFFSFAPNTGGGHFGPVTNTSSPNATGVIGVGDFNGDGNLDFVAAGVGIGIAGLQGIQVFLGNGDGTFRTGYMQLFGGAYPVAVYVGDFNRDGKLDLLVFQDNNGGWTTSDDVYELLGNGDGTFQTAQVVLSHTGPMVVADVNNDGHADIVTMLYPISLQEVAQPVQFSIYIGQADGSFLLTNTYAPYGDYGALPQLGNPPISGKYAPMVADFNGDGNLDIAAFQQVGTTTKDTFVQLLLGDGDGTFTPSYDVFDLRKAIDTAYAADLTGDGKADLFELNGYRSTYAIIPSTVAPPFQLGLLQDPVAGAQGSGIVVLDIAQSGTTTISLVSSDPAIKVPATVTIPAGSISKTFDFQVGSAFNKNHVFAVTATLGTYSVSSYASVVAARAAGYQLSAGGGQTSSWPNVNLGPGQTQSHLGVGAVSVNGYATTVTVQCLGLSAYAQCQIIPSTFPILPGDAGSGALIITVGANTPLGSYPATLEATDGVNTQSIPFTLNVGDFSMGLSPQVLQLVPSGNGSYELTVASTNMFNQVVTFTCGGLPAGASCSAIPFTYPPTGATPLTVGVDTQNVPIGNYQITVTGTSGPITHTATAQLQVSDFAASVAPLTATLKAGGSANFNVAVSPVNGFNGSVNFWCSTSSGLISCSFNPSTATVAANGTATSVLTLTASSQAASARKGLAPNTYARTVALYLALPFSLSVVFCRSRRRSTAILWLLFVMCALLSCGGGGGSGLTGGGGGSGGGGGGDGGNSQTYSVTVRVSASALGSSDTHSAGPITLTVN